MCNVDNKQTMIIELLADEVNTRSATLWSYVDMINTYIYCVVSTSNQASALRRPLINVVDVFMVWIMVLQIA